MADIMVTLIRVGATIDNQFIPDISVGQAWGRYWTENDLDFAYGALASYNPRWDPINSPPPWWSAMSSRRTRIRKTAASARRS